MISPWPGSRNGSRRISFLAPGNYRSPSVAKASGDQLAALRERLDTLDGAWLAVLAERFQVTQQVSALKAEAQLPLRDPAREASQLARIEAEAEARGVPPALARRLLELIQAQVVADHAAFQQAQAGDAS